MLNYETMSISELFDLRQAYEDAMIMAEEHGHIFQSARLSVYITEITYEIRRRRNTDN